VIISPAPIVFVHVAFATSTVLPTDVLLLPSASILRSPETATS